MIVRALWAVGAATVGAVALFGCGGKRTATGPAASGPTATAQLPGTGRPPVAVGDTNTYPEQFVLGALYEQALQAEGFSVTLNRNIGPPEVRIKALESGSVAVYPEYIDAWNSTIAGFRYGFASARAAYGAGQRFAFHHALKLLRPTPFSDTAAIGVTVAYAVNHGLYAVRDLRKVAQTLTMGGPPQFQSNSPGLAQVEQTYRFVPAAFRTIPVGDQYKALDQNTVQAADVNTTDGQLASGDYIVLVDPAHVFGWGNVVPVTSQTALNAEGPAFIATINKVSALLTTRVMRQLNADVAVLGEDPAKVAAQFLEAHQMLSVSPSS